MAELSRAVAALRITDEEGELDPRAITSALGCEPTRSWLQGETVTSHGHTRTTRFGMWSLHAPETAPADLDAQVTAILSRLTDDESVWAALRVKYNVHLFCGWFMEYGNEGVSIEPETMSALGARGILLDIDLYGGDSDKVPS